RQSEDCGPVSMSWRDFRTQIHEWLRLQTTRYFRSAYRLGGCGGRPRRPPVAVALCRTATSAWPTDVIVSVMLPRIVPLPWMLLRGMASLGETRWLLPTTPDRYSCPRSSIIEAEPRPCSRPGSAGWSALRCPDFVQRDAETALWRAALCRQIRS